MNWRLFFRCCISLGFFFLPCRLHVCELFNFPEKKITLKHEDFLLLLIVFGYMETFLYTFFNCSHTIPRVRFVFMSLFLANGHPSECGHPSAAQPLHEESVRNYVRKLFPKCPHAINVLTSIVFMCSCGSWIFPVFLPFVVWSWAFLSLQRNWQDCWGGDADALVWGGKLFINKSIQRYFFVLFKYNSYFGALGFLLLRSRFVIVFPVSSTFLCTTIFHNSFLKSCQSSWNTKCSPPNFGIKISHGHKHLYHITSHLKFYIEHRNNKML